MKQQRKIIAIFFFFGFGFAVLHAQKTIPATGGNASGSGGSLSYTVGQILCSSITGTNATIVQGVQQPYEISVVTLVSNIEEINLQCLVYPNPTRGSARLVIESPDLEYLEFRLFDINGVLLQNYQIKSSETEISLASLSSSVYFMKIYKNNMEIKVFKIIKK